MNDRSKIVCGLEVAAARFALGKINSWEIPPLAASALTEGIYSASLVELDALKDPKMSDVAPLFKAAMDELSISIPPRTDAFLIVARDIAQQIISGSKQPYNGAREIWWELATEPDAPKELLGFVGCASEYEDTDNADYKRQYEQDIVQLAKELVGPTTA